MSQELLFEIGTEELPASFIRPALESLSARLGEAMERWQVEAEVATVGTPRRLTIIARGLPEITPTRTVTVTGPPAAAAYKDGKPTRAAEGFARSRGVSLDALTVVETDKGPKLAAEVSEGETVRELLVALLPELTLGIPFKKAMRWGSGAERFARPLRWLVALYGGEVLPVTVAGLSAGRVTQGLRYAGPRELEVSGADDYLSKLAGVGIRADIGARKDAIRAMLSEAAGALGGEVHMDEALLEEVAGLVECPRVVAGRFAEQYLSLPDAVPVTVMKHHQRYFPVSHKDGGPLMNAFLQVTNNPELDEAKVRQGNERVLSARLSDGHFFWREDLKIPLEGRLPRLEGIIFHARLGSTADKVQRMRRLSRWLADRLGLSAQVGAQADRAAELSKADLVTWMVMEFPELQGLMGREYAQRGGEPEAVALAIEEHYLPKDAGGVLPRTEVGALVAAADRLDSIVAFHAIGKGPTGATDPYALRRGALGLLRILIDQEWDVSLSEAVGEAFAGVASRVQRPGDEVRAEVLSFLRTRLKGMLTSEGIPTDQVEAVLEAGSDRVADAALRARALGEMARGDDFRALMTAFKRAVNISRDQPDGGAEAMARLDGHGAALRDAVVEAQGAVGRAVGARDYPAALSRLLTLKAPVDAFFDNVMVMDPDPLVREARLAVLHQVAALFRGIADFGRLNA